MSTEVKEAASRRITRRDALALTKVLAVVDRSPEVFAPHGFSIRESQELVERTNKIATLLVKRLVKAKRA